jgi:hypothetical protein
MLLFINKDSSFLRGLSRFIANRRRLGLALG